MKTRAWDTFENPTFEVRRPDGEVVYSGKGFNFLRERDKHEFEDGDYEQYRSHDEGKTWKEPLYLRCEQGKLRPKVCMGRKELHGGILVPCGKLLGHPGLC